MRTAESVVFTLWLYAMNAGLPPELAVGRSTHDLEYDFFNAAKRGLAERHDLDAPPAPLAEARVHPEQVGREQRGLVTARAGADFGHCVAIEERIARDQ